MKYTTSISKITDDGMIIRGEKLTSLIENNSFSDAIFLILRARKPTAQESVIFTAMLTSVLDHGMGTTSSMTTRFAASAGNPLNAAVGAGVLAIGTHHGGAIEDAMTAFKYLLTGKTEKDIEHIAKAYVADALANKKTIFGYGHKVYKQEDPRVQTILTICKKQNYASNYLTLGRAIAHELEAQKGKKLCFNIDGCIAAILLEMGFSPNMGKGFFIIGRVPGLVAQALEEIECEKPVRRVEEEEIEYKGK